MFTKITHITLFVHDQNEALEFYTKKLGFKIHTDANFEGFRWLTLNLAEQPEFELVLMPATTQEEKDLVGKQGADKPLINLETSNCYRDFQVLSNAGVKFIQEPKDEPWGISACFVDLYGNNIYMCQHIQR